MSNNNGQNENFLENFDAITEGEIYQALIELGWILPRNEEELNRAEKALESTECPQFPPELEDPAPLIERLRKEQEAELNNSTFENEKPKSNLRLVAKNLTISEAEKMDTSDVTGFESPGSEEENAPSFPTLLRREIPDETPSVVAEKLKVTRAFLKLVSDYYKFIPDSWCDELAREAKNVYSIAEWRSKRTLTNPASYQAKAASRAIPYSDRKMDWREILQKSGLSAESEQRYRHLAEEEEKGQ